MRSKGGRQTKVALSIIKNTQLRRDHGDIADLKASIADVGAGFLSPGTVLKVECAWCGKDMGEKDGQGQEGTSHSICDECAAKMRGRRLDPYVAGLLAQEPIEV